MSGGKRAWSPTLGMGILRWGATPRDVFSFASDADVRIEWRACALGQNRGGRQPRRKAERTEWLAWEHFDTTDGERFVFRIGGPPT